MYIPTYMHACIHTYMHKRIHAYMHTCKSTYIQPIETYIHTYLDTYACMKNSNLVFWRVVEAYLIPDMAAVLRGSLQS